MITATSVGLQPAGYGNARFCWLDSSDPLIGAMIVPIVILLIVSVITIVMSIKLVLTTKRAIMKQDVRRDMRNGIYYVLVLADQIVVKIQRTLIISKFED